MKPLGQAAVRRSAASVAAAAKNVSMAMLSTPSRSGREVATTTTMVAKAANAPKRQLNEPTMVNTIQGEKRTNIFMVGSFDEWVDRLIVRFAARRFPRGHPQVCRNAHPVDHQLRPGSREHLGVTPRVTIGATGRRSVMHTTLTPTDYSRPEDSSP